MWKEQVLLEAASDLYSTAWTAFRKVTWPLSLPGVVAGTLLTFIPAAGDYINQALLGRAGEGMIGNVIDSTFLDQQDYPTAAALSGANAERSLVQQLQAATDPKSHLKNNNGNPTTGAVDHPIDDLAPTLLVVMVAEDLLIGMAKIAVGRE